MSVGSSQTLLSSSAIQAMDIDPSDPVASSSEFQMSSSRSPSEEPPPAIVREIAQWPDCVAAVVAMLPPKSDSVAREKFAVGLEWEVVRTMSSICNELMLTFCSGRLQQKLDLPQSSNIHSQFHRCWKNLCSSCLPPPLIAQRVGIWFLRRCSNRHQTHQ